MKPYRERAEHAWTEDSVRLILTPSLFARSALFHVQEIGHFHTLASYFTERERLDSFLIVYTNSGEGRLTYHKRTYSLTPGQAFFIDCMEYQHYSAVPGKPWELLWVHLNGPSARAYYDHFSRGGEPVRTLPPDSGFDTGLRELIELHRSKSVRSELLASRMITGLLTELLLTGSEFETSEIPGFISDVLKHIEKQYFKKSTLEQLAKKYAVNKYHLAKEFKKHTGFSPGEYIINTRISRAKELLKYTVRSVSEIAEEVGIENVSHFINLFRDRTGQTPLAFRKNWQAPKP